MTNDLHQARVEAAARVLAESQNYAGWETMGEYGRGSYRDDARAALAAADAVFAGDYHEGLEEGIKIGKRELADAHLPTVEQIAEVMAGHPIGSGYYQTTVGVGEAREMAEAVRALFGEVAGDE